MGPKHTGRTVILVIVSAPPPPPTNLVTLTGSGGWVWGVHQWTWCAGIAEQLYLLPWVPQGVWHFLNAFHPCWFAYGLDLVISLMPHRFWILFKRHSVHAPFLEPIRPTSYSDHTQTGPAKRVSQKKTVSNNFMLLVSDHITNWQSTTEAVWTLLIKLQSLLILTLWTWSIHCL